MRLEFEAWGVTLPEWPNHDLKFEAMVSALSSACAGEPIGYKFTKLIQVAHHVAESHPWLLVAFGHAVRLHGHQDLLIAQDGKGKWREKLEGKDGLPGIRLRVSKRDPSLAPDSFILSIIRFLFPEVGKKVMAYMAAQPV